MTCHYYLYFTYLNNKITRNDATQHQLLNNIMRTRDMANLGPSTLRSFLDFFPLNSTVLHSLHKESALICTICIHLPGLVKKR